MKIKSVQSEKQLKHGPHIRAVINNTGKFWIEYVVLHGRPFSSKSYDAVRRRMRVYYPIRDEVSVLILADLGLPIANVLPSFRKFRTALIPYSSKVWKHLSQIKTLREFASTINNVSISDEEMDVAESRHIRNVHANKSLVRDLRGTDGLYHSTTSYYFT